MTPWLPARQPQTYLEADLQTGCHACWQALFPAQRSEQARQLPAIVASPIWRWLLRCHLSPLLALFDRTLVAVELLRIQLKGAGIGATHSYLEHSRLGDADPKSVAADVSYVIHSPSPDPTPFCTSPYAVLPAYPMPWLLRVCSWSAGLPRRRVIASADWTWRAAPSGRCHLHQQPVSLTSADKA